MRGAGLACGGFWRRFAQMKVPNSVVLLLGLLHVYIGVRLLLPFGPVTQVVGALLLALCFVLLPKGFRIRDDRGPWAVMLPWLTMGFFSYLLVLTIVRDVSLIGSALALSPQAHEFWIRISAIGVMALTPAITLVGFFMARRTAPVLNVEVPLAHLPKALEVFTIAQIIDLHVGRRGRQRAGPRAPRRAARAARLPARNLFRHRQPRVLLGRTRVDPRARAPGRKSADERARGPRSRRSGVDGGGRHRLVRPPFRSHAQERSSRGGQRGARARTQGSARPPAALRSYSGGRWLPPAALRAHARRAVLAVEFSGAPAAAVHRGPRPPRPHVGLHQPRHRVLGTADAIRGAFGDHAHSPGQGVTARPLGRTSMSRAITNSKPRSRSDFKPLARPSAVSEPGLFIWAMMMSPGPTAFSRAAIASRLSVAPASALIEQPATLYPIATITRNAWGPYSAVAARYQCGAMPVAASTAAAPPRTSLARWATSRLPAMPYTRRPRPITAGT